MCEAREDTRHPQVSHQAPKTPGTHKARAPPGGLRLRATPTRSAQPGPCGCSNRKRGPARRTQPGPGGGRPHFNIHTHTSAPPSGTSTGALYSKPATNLRVCPLRGYHGFRYLDGVTAERINSQFYSHGPHRRSLGSWRLRLHEWHVCGAVTYTRILKDGQRGGGCRGVADF